MRTATGTRRALAVGAATTLLAGLGTVGAATANATTVDQTVSETVPAVTQDVPIKVCAFVNGAPQCNPTALPDTPELIVTLQLTLSEGSGVSLADGSESGALAGESCNLFAKTLEVDVLADSLIVLSVEGTDPTINHQVTDLVDNQTNTVEFCISQ